MGDGTPTSFLSESVINTSKRSIRDSRRGINEIEGDNGGLDIEDEERTIVDGI